MSDERTLELVSAAADGALSDDERAELERLLQDSPDARRFGTELDHLEAILNKVRDLLPPGTLHDQIMLHTFLPAAEASKPMFGWLRSLAPVTVLRYGMATAAGAVLAAFFYEGQPQFAETADIAELVGTMAPNRAATDAAILDTYAFQMEGLESLVQLERRDGALLLDIRIDADEPVDISVDFAAAGARLVALAQNEKSLESIEVAGQTLRVQALGRRQLTALLNRVDDTAVAGGAKIELEFSSKGKLLQRVSLTPAW